MITLKDKTIAVASGKGGVGKTTISVNLAVYYARAGYHTGLIDLDPLSDAATLLDIVETEDLLNQESIYSGKKKAFEKYVRVIFPNLDLIFSELKLTRDDKENLPELVFKTFYNNLVKNYDILILDMPAGILYNENLIYLQHTGSLIVVTNDEPTAHVSAGEYIKKALELEPEISISLWHNKYKGISTAGFNPKDLSGNYNKNVPEESRFNFTKVKINDIAFIPDDPAMDVLKSNPSLTVNILQQILERINIIHKRRVSFLFSLSDFSTRIVSIITNYIHQNKNIDSIDDYINQIGVYLKTLLETDILKAAVPDTGLPELQENSSIFTECQRENLESTLKSIKDDSITSSLVKLTEYLKETINHQENSERLFYTDISYSKEKIIDREMSILLKKINDSCIQSDIIIRNIAGLLVFDFSVYKLLKSETVVEFITDFIPSKKNSKGHNVRDKHRQIMHLIKEEKEYSAKYYKLIKTLYPIILTQISNIITTFELSGLLFKKEGKTNSKAYLKLLTTFIHHAVNSGLGIIIGFKHRPASIAFEESAEKLITELNISSSFKK